MIVVVVVEEVVGVAVSFLLRGWGARMFCLDFWLFHIWIKNLHIVATDNFKWSTKCHSTRGRGGEVLNITMKCTINTCHFTLCVDMIEIKNYRNALQWLKRWFKSRSSCSFFPTLNLSVLLAVLHSYYTLCVKSYQLYRFDSTDSKSIAYLMYYLTTFIIQMIVSIFTIWNREKFEEKKEFRM